MTDATPPGAARIGPWTLRYCVTAACTQCGAAPLDEDTGLTPHFDSAGQAREELPRDWGWHLTARSAWADDDELLCPACAVAGDAGNPPPPDPDPDGDREPEPRPWWEDPAQPRPALPPNAAVFPEVAHIQWRYPD
jgi:hypothetical protein